ncbi:MAG: nucleoside diphosphate kinase regulator [Deltaproteobacteria bacterium]|nr:nucleoside diphosphate kinase regulator [Deltaproteobacteria bacterium]
MIKALKVPKAIYITEKDLIRLERVLELAGPSSESEMLEEELLRATVVPSGEVPPDVVTMNSRVRFKDLTSDEESELTLCYPKDADLERGKISVLAPVGAALLGLKSGDEIEWPLPSGKTRVLKITDVVFQPEAAGQLHL